jgi:hypothetical protein
MESDFDKKDLAELNKRFKTRFLNEKKISIKNIFSIYDINEDTPIEPGKTDNMNDKFVTKEVLKEELGKLGDKFVTKEVLKEELGKLGDKFATKEELKQVETKLTSKMDANHAECIAKIDANQAKTDAKIDANHAATMAMFAELKKMIADISNSNSGTKQ